MSIWGRAAGVVVLGVLLAGCAGAAVRGTATPVAGATPSTEAYRSKCVAVTAPDPGPVPTPTGPPIITVTQGSNAWIANERIQPFAITVYAEGTAIRSEDAGTSSAPVARLTLGRIDPCRVAEAGAEIVALAASDLGDPAVTDQGTTRVVLHQPTGDVVVDAYALGVADQDLTRPQQAARQRLTALLDRMRTAMTQTGEWTPDRLRVTTYGTPADAAGAARWPLDGSLREALDRDGHRCGVLSGADVTSVLTAPGSTAVGAWTDGTQTLVLAFGPLVPGQPGCPG